MVRTGRILYNRRVPYELIDHTGDIGIVVRAPAPEALFADAARAMFEIMVDARDPRGGEALRFGVPAEPRPEDLRDFLADLLYRFSAERRMFVSFEPSSPGAVIVGTEPFDPERHALRTELKAVTWHQLRLAQEDGGWRAQVIFDV
jgi:SHS2 domain-containing protein